MHFLESTKDMGLSEENQRWVDEQIRNAVFPNGWRKAASWLRYWGLLASVIAIILALFTGMS